MDRLVLLDSNSLINRAFYAINANLSDDEGRPTNAVYGFLTMLLKIIKDIKPTHMVAVFDMKAPTFRKEMYAEYKAQRKPMDEALVEQLPRLKELLTAMGIKVDQKEGFEADDIIGTYSKKTDCDTVIVTADRDSLQLVDASTKVFLTKKGMSEVLEINPDNIFEHFSYTAEQVVDIKALMGDASDNIPGVGGVGEKTALSLIGQYGTLENVYAHIEEQKGKLKERLENDKEKAFLSKKLATIEVNVPIQVNLKDCEFSGKYTANARTEMLKLGFKSIINKLEFSEEVEVEISAPAEKPAKVVKVASIEALGDCVNELVNAECIAFFINENVHISASFDKCFEIVIDNSFLSDGMTYAVVMERVKPILENAKIGKICFDYKLLKRNLESEGIFLDGLKDDVMLKDYVLDATKNYKDLKEFAFENLGGEKANASNMLRLDKALGEKLAKQKLLPIYKDLELPLAEVLFDMEKEGFKVDVLAIDELREKFSIRLSDLTAEIEKLAEESFNINSPKQLGVILFEKLGLKKGRKNKTSFSTDAEVLKMLEDEHPIIPLILEYREISKLNSTYVEGMTKHVDLSQKLHTIFRQAVTATGRLSSTEPNLQNIPVRKPEGKILRKMFIASEGCKLVCADYSQIELRLLAHFSKDEALKYAYEHNEDIHSLTASKVYGVPLSEVSAQMRSSAKAVNFGIIYGISDFGLSKDIGVSPYEAKRFIEKYFESYPQVKEYMDANVAFAKENGYIASISGRIRKISELKSSNYNIRKFGERIAMNMPLQGSASDIVKIAMLAVFRKLKENGLKAKMIMQVHDELIIDTPLSEVEQVKNILKTEMERAVKLNVPLTVEVGVGENWLDAK